MSIKEEVIESLAQLPDEATLEEIKYHLYYVLTIKPRLADKSAPTLTHEDVVEQIKQHWRK